MDLEHIKVSGGLVFSVTPFTIAQKKKSHLGPILPLLAFFFALLRISQTTHYTIGKLEDQGNTTGTRRTTLNTTHLYSRFCSLFEHIINLIFSETLMSKGYKSALKNHLGPTLLFVAPFLHLYHNKGRNGTNHGLFRNLKT